MSKVYCAINLIKTATPSVFAEGVVVFYAVSYGVTLSKSLVWGLCSGWEKNFSVARGLFLL